MLYLGEIDTKFFFSRGFTVFGVASSQPYTDTPSTQVYRLKIISLILSSIECEYLDIFLWNKKYLRKRIHKVREI